MNNVFFENIFINVLNMSITISFIIPIIILLRFLFRKSPKWPLGILWALVAVRLLCPFSFESDFSFLPHTKTIPQNIITSNTPTISSGIPVIISESVNPDTNNNINPIHNIFIIAAIIWVIGFTSMVIYMIISYNHIKKQLLEAVNIEDNIFICDNISNSFIIGLSKPKIYIPSDINEKDYNYVIAHEKAHIKRLDHIFKFLGFLLLSVYWFNPLIWIAYILFCQDIELACDEKVINILGSSIKKSYSEALVNCSSKSKIISVQPLAFAEIGIKERVKNILRYKKNTFIVIFIIIIFSIFAVLCMFSNPSASNTDNYKENDSIHYMDYSTIKHYTYSIENTSFSTTNLIIDYYNKDFRLHYSVIDSSMVTGTAEEYDDYLVLKLYKTDDYNNVYTFKKDGNNLIYIADKSLPIPHRVYSGNGLDTIYIPDGAIFKPTVPA